MEAFDKESVVIRGSIGVSWDVKNVPVVRGIKLDGKREDYLVIHDGGQGRCWESVGASMEISA